jgi:hypothetical protein
VNYMNRVVLTVSCCVLALGLAACDKGGEDKSAEAKPEDKEADVAQAAVKQDDKAAPVAEPSKPDAPVEGMGGVIQAAVGEQQGATPTGPTPAAAAGDAASPPHFDTSKNTGMLDRLASSLVQNDSVAAAQGTAKGAMSAIARLARGDTTISDATICAHILSIMAKEFGDALDEKTTTDFTESCNVEIEKERLKLGSEVFAESASCIMAAQSFEAIGLCDKASKEAKEEIAEKPSGEVDKATCEAVIDHLFAIMRKEMGTDPEMLEILDKEFEGMKADAVITCMDTATKAEIECAMKANTLAEMDSCDG